MSSVLLRARVLGVQLCIIASMLLLAACISTGTINWTVTQTIPTPAPSGVDYVPTCLPTDPPGSYCQPAP